MCCNVRCNKYSNQRRVSIYFNYYFSTVKWKASVDEAASFLDGGRLPCLLVENKIDLLDEGNENDPELENYAQSNGFCGCFRTSAKTGVNISESMEFLIKNIIKRMEDMSQKGNEVFTTERKNVSLDPQKHNEATTSQRKKNKDGCC